MSELRNCIVLLYFGDLLFGERELLLLEIRLDLPYYPRFLLKNGPPFFMPRLFD